MRAFFVTAIPLALTFTSGAVEGQGPGTGTARCGAALAADERWQAAVDLNGRGDASDHVMDPLR